MNEQYIAFDFSWKFLMFPLIIVFTIYVISHIANYCIQDNEKYLKRKYIIKEFTSAISSIFYTLLITVFLLYVTFTSTYISKIAQDNNIRSGADGLKYIIRMGLEKSN